MNMSWPSSVDTLRHALGLALASGRARIGTISLFLAALVFYAMLLPATSTGGTLGLVSLRFLSLGELLIALALSALLSLTVSLGVHGLRQGRRVNPTGTMLGAALALAPSLLCCTPAIPLAITAIASLLPAAGHFGVPIQGWIATHEGTLYAMAIAAMAWGLLGSARRVLSCAC
ncbi:MAG: hypothetical protein KGS28_10125 [Betaproteobacteria bacterium]|jgi:hypothetical protein|uniref:hypothetical protein n=1 Tax=Thiomonas sp. FB-6 TaxID=1158291 RepID=UPI0004755AD8|nr:hypothetical protein [Thiomonas sp. FB-6]MBU6440574.1 hypothetical protein [Betaproteobacteria bacterium]